MTSRRDVDHHLARLRTALVIDSAQPIAPAGLCKIGYPRDAFTRRSATDQRIVREPVDRLRAGCGSRRPFGSCRVAPMLHLLPRNDFVRMIG